MFERDYTSRTSQGECMNCVNKYRVVVPKYWDLTSGKNNINTAPRWCYEVYDCAVCKWNVTAVNCGGTNGADLP